MDIAIINHTFLMVYDTHKNGDERGWFMTLLIIPTLAGEATPKDGEIMTD